MFGAAILTADATSSNQRGSAANQSERSRSRTRREASIDYSQQTPTIHQRNRSTSQTPTTMQQPTLPSSSPLARATSLNVNGSAANSYNNDNVNGNSNNSADTDIQSSPSTSTESYVIDKRQRLEEQARRQASIHREEQIIQQQIEKEDIYWQLQSDKFSKLVERSEIGALTAKELHKYLIRQGKLMQYITDTLETFEGFGTQETGTLSSACSAQNIQLKTTCQYINDIRAKQCSDNLKLASNLSKTMTYRMEALDENGRRILKSVRLDRQHMNDAWQNYEKSVEYRAVKERDEKTLNPTKDPYLLCRAYDKEVNNLRNTEIKYRKQMGQIYYDMKIEEKQRIEQVKSILINQLNTQKQLFQNLISYTDSAMTAVTSINSDNDVMEFVHSTGLIVPQSSVNNIDYSSAESAATSTSTQPQLASVALKRSATVTTPASKSSTAAASTAANASTAAISTPPNYVSTFDIPAPVRDNNTLLRLYSHELDKEGALYRQGKIIRSSWKLIHAAISKSGFFHWGEADDQKGPADGSISLYDCSVQLSPQRDPSAFELYYQPVTSWLSSFPTFTSSNQTYYFKASTPSQAQDWVAALKKYANKAPKKDSKDAKEQALKEKLEEKERATQVALANDSSSPASSLASSLERKHSKNDSTSRSEHYMDDNEVIQTSTPSSSSAATQAQAQSRRSTNGNNGRGESSSPTIRSAKNPFQAVKHDLDDESSEEKQ